MKFFFSSRRRHTRSLCDWQTCALPILLALVHARGVERAADDVVAHARQILHAAAADHHDRLLLQIMPFARVVGRHLEPVGQPDPRDLPQRRIWLLGRRGVYASADAALLRIAAQRGCLLFRFHVAAAVPDELIDSRQISLTRIEKSCSEARETKQVVRLRSRVGRKAGGPDEEPGAGPGAPSQWR